jgi:hypothetical protein
MASEYSRIVNNFLLVPFPQTDRDRVIFGNQPEPFFEFDALVAAGIRALDTVRGALWRIAGERGSVPSSFRRTLDQCGKLDTDVRSRLELLWNDHCAKAKEYMDCIQHYVSPGAHKGFADMERFEPNVWGMRAWLPDNPEGRSARNFVFHQQLDALSYGWRFADSVLQIVEIVFTEANGA